MKRLLYCFNDALECLRAILGEGGKDLAIKLYSLDVHHVDETTVLDIKGSESGIDTDSPEATEVILLVFAVRKSVELGVVDSFLRDALLL